MAKVSQSESGKAWEYGLARVVAETLLVPIIGSKSKHYASSAYENLDIQQRIEIDSAAQVAISFLQVFDSNMKNAKSVSMMADYAGKKGDVRDILIRTDKSEIGISAKHRHKALKHSRLSATNNFGDTWYGKSCSQEYWDSVIPIFQKLSQLKNEGKLWKEIENKFDDVYLPISKAFANDCNMQMFPN